MTRPATVTAAEIAQAAGTTKRSILRRAAEEGWAYADEPAQGGLRRVFTVDDLPAALRAKLLWRPSTPETAAAARDGRVQVAREELRANLQARANEGRQVAALRESTEMGPRAQQRIDTRLGVLRAFEAFCLAEGAALPKALRDVTFAQRWTAGQLDVHAGLRQAVPTLTDRTLREWQKLLREGGISALAGAYGNRAGSGKIDSQPEVQAYVQAMLAGYPHARSVQVMAALRARFGGDAALPSSRSLQRWMDAWRETNRDVLALLQDPDGWRNKYLTAFGSRSEHVVRINQLWELDSSPADLMCTDGRYALIGGIDVYTRRARIFVARTSKAVGVAALTRRMLIDLGVPETAKTDNGSDYTSKHVVRVFAGLGVKHDLCTPFSPDQKPHIERFFGTFARGLLELMPGYIGHSVADRKAIEAQRSFAQRLMKRDEVVEVRLTGADLQRFCDEWTSSIYEHQPHEGLDKRTPFEVAAAQAQHVRRIEDERALDVLLADAPEGDGWRTVQKKGVRVDESWFIAPELHAYIGQRVRVRFDPLDHDLGRIFISGEVPGVAEEAFICIAEDPTRTGMDRREVAAKARALQRERGQQARKALKQLQKRVGVHEAAQEVLKDRAAAAGKLTVLRPVAGAPGYTSPGLEMAAKAVRAATAAQRTTADIANLAEVQAAQARIAAEQVPQGQASDLAARRGAAGTVATPVFETVGARVHWLLLQADVRPLSTEEQDTLAQYRRASPAAYRRMAELVAEQLGSAKKNGPDRVEGGSEPV